MHISKYKIVFVILISLLALQVTFGQKDSTRLKRMSEKKLTKNIVSNYCTYKNLSFKIDAKIETPEKTYNLNITYRNIRDSIIWININHNTGIPVARLLITPDSTKMLNRLDNKYLRMSNDQIIKKFGYDVSFEMIQSIFTAQLINMEPEKALIQTYKHYKVYQDSGRYIMQNINKNRLSRLHKKDKIDEYLIHKVFINAQFKILSTSLEDNIHAQKINVVYPKYEKEGQCMEEIKLTFSKKGEITKMRLKIKKIKLDKKKLSISFKVPDKYERVTLKP